MMRRGATVVQAVGDLLTLDVGGGDYIIARGKASVGDSVVVVVDAGNTPTQRAGQRAAVEGVGSFLLLPGEQMPARVRVSVEPVVATEPEVEFGEDHRVVPTLFTLEYARSLHAAHSAQ
jgi:hypothetical protein